MDGVESTNFGFDGTGEEYVLYLFMNINFKSMSGIDPFFSDAIKGFGVAK
jgi:hypothetical protein